MHSLHQVHKMNIWWGGGIYHLPQVLFLKLLNIFWWNLVLESVKY